MKKLIEKVTVLKSQIEHGGVVSPCLAVIIDPYPDTEHKLELVGEEIRACMLGLKKEDVE